MAFLGYNNRLTGVGTWTGTSFNANPPIENLGTRQTPSPHAEFTGATGTLQFAALDAAGSAEAFAFRLLALIGHTLPDGATVTWKRGSDDTTIASQTIARFRSRPQNSYILLDSAVTESTIYCEIASAGTGAHRIAAAWASPIWEFKQSADFAWSNQSSAQITRISGTDWAFADARRRGIPISAVGTRGEIIGINRDGTAGAGTDAETVLHDIGLYGPVIVGITDASQTAIDATAIYGTLDSVGTPEQVSGDVFRMSFNVAESR